MQLADTSHPPFQDSRSQRILWQLCEMDIPFNIVNHHRQADKRSPPSLFAVDSLGRAPVLVLPDGRKIIESGAISAYLIKYYDKRPHIFADADWIREEQYALISESSIDSWNSILLVCNFIIRATPWFLRPIMSLIFGQIKTAVLKEQKKQIVWLRDQLGDREWFSDNEVPGRADFLLILQLDFITGGELMNFEKEFPKLHAWQERCRNRPAWKRALNEGNGYNTAKF